MDISITYQSGVPIYRQIIDQVLFQISAGVLKKGDRLLTIEELSKRLSVNPNTVAKAYREMELKGIIWGKRGNGTFLADKTIKISSQKKKAKIKEIFERGIAEAAQLGISTEEIQNYFQRLAKEKRYV